MPNFNEFYKQDPNLSLPRKINFTQNLQLKIIIRNFVKFKFTDFKNQFRKVIF